MTVRTTRGTDWGRNGLRHVYLREAGKTEARRQQVNSRTVRVDSGRTLLKQQNPVSV